MDRIGTVSTKYMKPSRSGRPGQRADDANLYSPATGSPLVDARETLRLLRMGTNAMDEVNVSVSWRLLNAKQ
jgi:hypothetical protein